MQTGLEGVVAAETALSDVEGLVGRLTIKGMPLDRLVATCGYEDVVALLLAGLFEDLPEAPMLRRMLGAARRSVFPEVERIDAELLALPPFGAVRALIARLDDGNDLATALRLMAGPAVFLPAVLRLRQGERPVMPEEQRSLAADFLRMLHGTEPSTEQITALEAYLVTVSDHGLNASTFASRVVASTGAGLTSATLAAFGALSGPLHGGAPGPVLDMLDAVGDPARAETWLRQELDGGRRLMGFGHRIYRVRDPRADALKGALRPLVATGQVDHARIRLAESVEAAALRLLEARKPGRRLDTNVEFYTALLLEALGFPRTAFTAVFAAGRVAGWLGHAREQQLHGRLIRPLSRYVGPQPEAA